MEPIAYSMNNVFITDWNEKDYTRLDFGDIFERFYKEAYGINCPYVMNDNLSVKNEYRIPADEFENVIAQHIGISREELHKLSLYDADSDSYLYRPRGYGEYDYEEIKRILGRYFSEDLANRVMEDILSGKIYRKADILPYVNSDELKLTTEVYKKVIAVVQNSNIDMNNLI